MGRAIERAIKFNSINNIGVAAPKGKGEKGTRTARSLAKKRDAGCSDRDVLWPRDTHHFVVQLFQDLSPLLRSC